MSKIKSKILPPEFSNEITWAEAILEIEGLIYEEVSKLQKKQDFYTADLLTKSIKVIKRGY